MGYADKKYIEWGYAKVQGGMQMQKVENPCSKARKGLPNLYTLLKYKFN